MCSVVRDEPGNQEEGKINFVNDMGRHAEYGFYVFKGCVHYHGSV